jgi:alpha-L-fucosidase
MKKRTLVIKIILVYFFFCCQMTSAQEAEILKSEMIFENASFPSCHASTIVETRDGLLAAWFGGTREKHPDVCIYSSMNREGKWSDPVMIADGIVNDSLRYPCWNPVLFRRSNRDVVLYYKVGPSPQAWWGMYKISSDGGRTWTPAVKIGENLLGPIKNKPVKLRTGMILYPTSVETPDKWNIYIETSDQDMKNWKSTSIDNNGFNAIQPTILFYSKGKIQMLCRSREKRIVETWSGDLGKTWTPLKAIPVANNNSGIDAVTLRHGLQLLVCNPVEKGRNKLSLLGSINGKEWNEIIVLEDQPEGEFSYPAIIKGKNGRVHITYTYNRKTIKYVSLVIKMKGKQE